MARVALTHGYFLVSDLEKVLEGPPVDVVIGGEACEWEAGPYFMDLIASGQKKGMILLGSQVSERARMRRTCRRGCAASSAKCRSSGCPPANPSRP